MKKILLLLLTIPVILSCTQGEKYSERPQDNFHALWTCIDQHYCFLDYKQQEAGTDWDEVYTRYRSRITDQMTRQQLFEVLCEMLSELRDGHVNLLFGGDIGRNWSWHEDYPKNLDEELREQYLGTGTDYRLTNNIPYRILPSNVGYLVCSSFEYELGEGNICQILNYMRTCNGIIIDLRGNGGGLLTSAERLASHFTNDRVNVGYISHKTGPGHNDFSAPQPEYIDPSQYLRWQKPCVVLTNRSCYSAANTFVRNMKAIAADIEKRKKDNPKDQRRIIILGDQTGGGSGLPFNTELPNGWTIRFSACPMFDEQMNHIEFGIQPHISCQLSPEDAQQGFDTLIEAAIAIINH